MGSDRALKRNHPAPPLKMILRGALGACPRCGHRKLWVHWFKMKERCPTCGYKIARDEGFWLGGYVMNVVIGEGLLALHLLIFAGYILNHPDASIRPWMTVAVVLALVPPILLFPVVAHHLDGNGPADPPARTMGSGRGRPGQGQPDLTPDATFPGFRSLGDRNPGKVEGQAFLGSCENGVAGSGPGSFGRPSARSPMMLRWIWSVPP